jgi:hypothetical protein
MCLGRDERQPTHGYCLGHSRLLSGRLPGHGVEECRVPDLLPLLFITGRIARACGVRGCCLVRPSLRNIGQASSDVHCGERTQVSLCVVGMHAGEDSTAADAPQPYYDSENPIPQVSSRLTLLLDSFEFQRVVNESANRNYSRHTGCCTTSC